MSVYLGVQNGAYTEEKGTLLDHNRSLLFVVVVVPLVVSILFDCPSTLGNIKTLILNPKP